MPATRGEEMRSLDQKASEADYIREKSAKKIAEYADHGLPFRWCVGPLTAPAPEDFGALLGRYGFTWLDGRGMAIDPASRKASHA